MKKLNANLAFLLVAVLIFTFGSCSDENNTSYTEITSIDETELNHLLEFAFEKEELGEPEIFVHSDTVDGINITVQHVNQSSKFQVYVDTEGSPILPDEAEESNDRIIVFFDVTCTSTCSGEEVVGQLLGCEPTLIGTCSETICVGGTVTCSKTSRATKISHR
ncbi:MAG: hypothetical protein AAGA77_09980 [Bacteroidota bacterium]